MALSTSSLSPCTIFTTTRETCKSSSFPLLLRSISKLSAKPYNPNLNLGLITGSNSEKWRTRVSFFPAFLKKGKDAKAIKEELLEAIAPLDRGAEATTEDQETVDQIARKLEAVNPTKEPLKSSLLNGKWELIYTTSASILQRERPKFLRSTANYQAINADILRAQNMESRPFFNQIPVKAPDRARGELEITYLDEELRLVLHGLFKTTKLKCPDTSLAVMQRIESKPFAKILKSHLSSFQKYHCPCCNRIYLINFLFAFVFDRVSRGDKGNLFILKMIDPSYRIPG